MLPSCRKLVAVRAIQGESTLSFKFGYPLPGAAPIVTKDYARLPILNESIKYHRNRRGQEGF